MYLKGKARKLCPIYFLVPQLVERTQVSHCLTCHLPAGATGIIFWLLRWGSPRRVSFSRHLSGTTAGCHCYSTERKVYLYQESPLGVTVAPRNERFIIIKSHHWVSLLLHRTKLRLAALSEAKSARKIGRGIMVILDECIVMEFGVIVGSQSWMSAEPLSHLL